MTAEQEQTIRFLIDVALERPVTRIDTHAAVVLLSGDRAYKMKRAVRFSFLDFSTLDRREQTLRTELVLNRRTAPDLYLRVLPVTRGSDGELALDDRGEPVEWLLEMRRFPSDATLDRIADRGRLRLSAIDQLAAVIASFHEGAEHRRDRGGFAGMCAVVDENADNLREFAGTIFPATQVTELADQAFGALRQRKELLEARRRDGFVRHCHGDLHLANIVEIAGAPVLFDCLEFNEEYACIDVLYDLAFLVMDLLDRDLAQHAQRLLQGWIDRTSDDSALALLPLFLATRAVVRAKVIALQAVECTNEEERRRLAGKALVYFALARRALAPASPRLVAIGGRSGTGKSALAMSLAPRLGALPGAIVLRSDVIRKALVGEEPTRRLGLDAYAPDVSARVYARIAARARALIGAGHSVIADAVFGSSDDRALIEETATNLSVPFNGLWLTAPEAVLETRVAQRQDDASDADVDVVRSQRSIDCQASWLHISSGRPLDQVLHDASRALR